MRHRFLPQLAFIVLLAPLSPARAQSETPCQKSISKIDSPHMAYKAYCHSNGNLARYEVWFKEANKVSMRWTLNTDEKLISFETFAVEGHRVQHEAFEPLGGSLYRIRYEREIEKKPGTVESVLNIDLFPEVQKTLLNSTYFKQGHYGDVGDKEALQKFLKEEFTQVDGYAQVAAIELYRSGGALDTRYEVKTVKGPKSTQLIERFRRLDAQGKERGLYDAKLRPPLDSSTAAQAKLPVAIIDSGIDSAHPGLKGKFAAQPGYGVFPGFVNGWFFDPATEREDNDIRDQLYYSLGRFPYVPMSHGTHVAALAIRGIETYGLIGISGDFSNAEYLVRIRNWLSASRTRFANMSFGFGDQKNPFAAGSESRWALLNLMQENSQTLFFVAAGNDGVNLDQPEKDDVPAKAPVDNKLVVAALNTAYLEKAKLESYRLTSFSTYGVETVDVASPGDDVLSLNIGGGTLRLPGTSMASPIALNIALAVAETAPRLSNREIKSLILKTAYVPSTHTLPVRSGGIAIKERAVFAAKLTKQGLSIDEASLAAIKNMPLGDKRSHESIRTFWKERKL